MDELALTPIGLSSYIDHIPINPIGNERNICTTGFVLQGHCVPSNKIHDFEFHNSNVPKGIHNSSSIQLREVLY